MSKVEFHINADSEPPQETVELLATVAEQVHRRHRKKSWWRRIRDNCRGVTDGDIKPSTGQPWWKEK